MKASEQPATGHDIACVMIWITTLGKALVKKGLVSRIELTEPLNELYETSSPEIRAEIDNMRSTIFSW